MNNNRQNKIIYPWDVVENYPKAAAISDSYLIECEKKAEEKAHEMLKASGAVPSGLTILIIGGLLAAQMPYWWHLKTSLPPFVALFWILGFATAALAVFNEYYKASPIKTSDINSQAALKDFWCTIAEDQQKSEDVVCRDLNIFIRKNRSQRTDYLQEVEAKKNCRLRFCLAIEWAGIVLLAFSTFLVISNANQHLILDNNQNTSIVGNSSIDEYPRQQAND